MGEDCAAVKGVMLAERPPDALRAALLPVFVPAYKVPEPLGLNPTHHQREEVAGAACQGTPITTLHKRWVRELQHVLRQQHSQELQAAEAQQQSRQALATFTTRLRSAVLQGGEVGFWKASMAATTRQRQRQQGHPAHQPQAASSAGGGAAPQAPPLECSEADVEAAPAAAAHSTGPAAAETGVPCSHSSSPATVLEPPNREGPAGGQRRPTSAAKPAWALSSHEAAAAAAAEEEQLVAFAQGLDFDSFCASLEDPQLQQGLQVLNQEEQQAGAASSSAGGGGDEDANWRAQFVRAFNQARQLQPTPSTSHSQPVEDDSQSQACRSVCSSRWARHVAAGKAEGWDAVSAVSKDVTTACQEVAASALAQEFLRENPDLRGTHSAASVKGMLSRLEPLCAS